MKDKGDVIQLPDVDEASCAFVMVDASRIRRMVQLMPEMSPTSEFLNMLWAYAARHNRLADLANDLLGFDERHKTTDGNENCDLKLSAKRQWIEFQRFELDAQKKGRFR